jgi:hypothetical protein
MNVMLKNAFVICVGLFLFSCGSPASEETVKEEVKEKEPIEVRDLVNEYKTFLASLDSKSEKSMTVAAEKYTELFSGTNEKVCDSAYVLFDGLYAEIEGNLNDKLMKDKFFENFPCITLDSLGEKEKPFEKKFVPFKKSIEKNGFRINCPEGMVEIGQDRSFVAKHFYAFVSPVMKQFLEALRKEHDFVFSEDAGIIISPKEYVDRLVWWEKFNTANPDFILSKKAKSHQIQLFHFFLTGMDNTPIIDSEYDENGEIIGETMDAYFVEGYAYLNKKYPNSEANALVKPYKMALLKKEQAKSERLIRSYTKRGLMIDFEKGYDLDL